MKPISINPLTGSIVDAANSVSRDIGIPQLNGNAQEVGSGILPIHAGAGKAPQADVETALKTAQAALEAAKAALEAAENAQKDITDLETDVNNKQDTLESGVNIKTINGMTVLGGGNMVLMPCIQHYKWASNVATTRKQVPTELRAKGIKISYNDNSGVYHVEQYQSDDISDEAWANDANWKGCRTPLTPMFEAAGAVFNEETGLYRIDNDNGIYLDNLTEDEVLEAYTCRIPFVWVNDTLSFNGTAENPRIYFPVKVNAATSVTFSSGFQSKTKLERMGLSMNHPITMPSTYYGCLNLEQLFITSNVSVTFRAVPFDSCKKLTLLKIGKLISNLEIPDSPLVTLESLSYIVTNVANTSAITITVHPDVYAKLTDESNTEWYAVNTAAQAKNIAFATAETAQVATLADGVEPQIEVLNGEFVCPSGCYMTQAEDVTIENRLFLTRRIVLNGEDVSKWRIATAEEKQEQDNYFASQLPTE